MRLIDAAEERGPVSMSQLEIIAVAGIASLVALGAAGVVLVDRDHRRRERAAMRGYRKRGAAVRAAVRRLRKKPRLLTDQRAEPE